MFSYITIFLLTIIGIIGIKHKAKLFGLVDIPNERSMHEKVVPRGAGIAFVLSVFIVLLFLNYEFMQRYYYIFLAIFVTFIAGLWDDIKDVSPKVKFIFLFASALILYLNDFYLDNLGTYFGISIAIPSLLIFPFTFFALAGYTNALNLMDGLDGLAASISIIMMSVFFMIGLHHNNELLITLSSFFIVTLLAFMLFNWHPAKVFMGDSGSLTLGIVIVILAIESVKYITPISILFITALPLLDTFIVIIRRIQRNISPFTADKSHMHHTLFRLKRDVSYTVIMFMLMQLIFSLIGYQIRRDNEVLSVVVFTLLFIVFFNLFDQRLKRRKKRI